jgi:hypothetical protein
MQESGLFLNAICPSEVPPLWTKQQVHVIQTTFNNKKFHNKQVKQNMTNKPKKREGTSPVYIKYSSNQEENYLLGESPAPFIYHFEK